MELIDLFIAPLYMLIFYAIATKIRNKHFKGHPFEPYFMKALHLKFFGAIAAGMVYWFYYGYGDTRGYFNRGIYIHELIVEDFSNVLYYLFPSKGAEVPYAARRAIGFLRPIDDPASYFMYRISAIMSFITFSSYTVIALFFAFFSFISSLYFYKVLVKKITGLEKEIAIAIFFIPSVFFWGSGLFKDSLTFAGICLVAGAGFNLLSGYKPLKSFLLLCIGVYLTLSIKAYILLSFAPCFGVYIFLSYGNKIKSGALRALMLPFFLALGILTGYLFLQQISSASPDWNVESMEKRATDMQRWHTQVSKYQDDGYGGGWSGGGSSYSLGAPGDFSASGLLQKFPLAISVTFFRPFPWEVRSPIMLLASLEGLFFLWITLKSAKKYGFYKYFQHAFSEPIVLLCLMFSLIFGFAVGFTSYNYGALVRYKIPCLPFYLLFVYLNNYYLDKKAVLKTE
jgi:hypothetical protein